MRRIFKFGTLSILCLNVTACTPNISPDSYAIGAVGQTNRAVRGVIVSAREVDISGSRSGVGGAAGAAAGGVGGSAIGSSVRGNVVGAIGGAVVGGIIGSVVEEGTTAQKGMEYVVETENGALITVVQGIDQPLSTGRKVIVLYGSRARVIPDPKN
jgi:outer membrane lipoprotein SlyB